MYKNWGHHNPQDLARKLTKEINSHKISRFQYGCYESQFKIDWTESTCIFDPWSFISRTADDTGRLRVRCRSLSLLARSTRSDISCCWRKMDIRNHKNVKQTCSSFIRQPYSRESFWQGLKNDADEVWVMSLKIRDFGRVLKTTHDRITVAV